MELDGFFLLFDERADVSGPATDGPRRIRRQVTVLAYPKDDHVPADFTVLNIAVSDLEATVDQLVGRGVEMLRFEGFAHDERGIVRGGDNGPDIAWFADPSGNILSALRV